MAEIERSILLIFDQQFSIGEKSGEYGGVGCVTLT